MRYAIALVAFFGFVNALPAQAQQYPAKPIRLIVPFVAGGSADVLSRVLAQPLNQQYGQQVVVENRPGSGGHVGAEAAAHAAPDGYTIVFGTIGIHAAYAIYSKLSYDPARDLQAVALYADVPCVLIVHPSVPARTVREFIALAKQNPGRLNIGCNNIGSTQQLASELFKSMAGIEAQVVPFKAISGLLTALRSGEVHIVIELAAPVMQQIRSNAVKALAIGSKERFVGLPGVPTVAEGGVPGYQASSWNGVSVPARTPRPVIDRLYREFAAAIAMPDVRQRLQDMGIDPRAYTPEQTRELMISDIAKWKAVIERANIPRQ